jgi:hypothetical protein
MTIFAGIELTIPATIFGSLSFAAAPFFHEETISQSSDFAVRRREKGFY